MDVPENPQDLIWKFEELPPIENVRVDAWIMVWKPVFGLIHPHGDELNPTRWCDGSNHPVCTDGLWTEERGKARELPDGSFLIRENDVNLVQYRTIRKPVWWAWVSHGTPGSKHRYPTWREIHGSREESDWK